MPPPPPPARPNKPQIALPMGEKAAAEVIPNASPTPDPNERWAPPRAATPSTRRSVAPSRKKKMAPVTFQLPYKLRPSIRNSSKIEESKCGLPGSRGWDWLAMDGEARARRPHQMTFNQLAMASFNNAFRRGGAARGAAVSRSSPRPSNAGSGSARGRIRGPARSGCRCVAARARSGMRSGVRGAERPADVAGCGTQSPSIACGRPCHGGRLAPARTARRYSFAARP